jgi:DNA mismatch endonuclease (patch repair protein)
MRQVRSRNTSPEVRVRKIVHGLGYRYSLNSKKLPGCPDVVLTRLKTVIFVHGCFWHGHDCEAATLPETNREYWTSKQNRNRTRDRRAARELREAGWRVLVVWECQTRDRDRLARRLEKLLGVQDRLYSSPGSC